MVEKLTERIQLVASKEFIELVDDWRRKQKEIPSRSEAIRQLVKRAIENDSSVEAAKS